MDELTERVAASRDYDMLQGLIAVGTGVALLAGVFTDQPIVMTFVAVLTCGVAESWYRKRYGKKRASNGRNMVAVAIGALAVILLLVASGLDYFKESPVLVTSLLGAALLAVGYRLGLKHIGMTVWHWVVIGALALSSLLPLVGRETHGYSAYIPLALALIALGLIDHARLVRIFGPGERE